MSLTNFIVPLALLLFLPSLASAVQPPQPRRFVLINLDDVGRVNTGFARARGWDTTVASQPLTPTIDSIAANGVVAKNMMAGPNCHASRLKLLGMGEAHRPTNLAGTVFRVTGPGDHPWGSTVFINTHDSRSLFHRAKSHGYETYAGGKMNFFQQRAIGSAMNVKDGIAVALGIDVMTEFGGALSTGNTLYENGLSPPLGLNSTNIAHLGHNCRVANSRANQEYLTSVHSNVSVIENAKNYLDGLGVDSVSKHFIYLAPNSPHLPSEFGATPADGCPSLLSQNDRVPSDTTSTNQAGVFNKTITDIDLRIADIRSRLKLDPVTGSDILCVTSDNGIAGHGADDIIEIYRTISLGYMSSGNIGTVTNQVADVSALAAISTGSFRIAINGVTEDISGVDFSGDTTPADIAATVQAAIRLVGTGGFSAATVTNYVPLRIRITSGTQSMNSSVSLMSATGAGTDVSGPGFLNSRAGSSALVTDGGVLAKGSQRWKSSPYPAGVQVPLVCEGRGITPNQTITSNIGMSDLNKTVDAILSGGSGGGHLDGQSFASCMGSTDGVSDAASCVGPEAVCIQKYGRVGGTNGTYNLPPTDSDPFIDGPQWGHNWAVCRKDNFWLTRWGGYTEDSTTFAREKVVTHSDGSTFSAPISFIEEFFDEDRSGDSGNNSSQYFNPGDELASTPFDGEATPQVQHKIDASDFSNTGVATPARLEALVILQRKLDMLKLNDGKYGNGGGAF